MEKGAKIDFSYWVNGSYNNIDLSMGVRVVPPLTSLHAPAVGAAGSTSPPERDDVALLRACIVDAERACDGFEFGPSEIQSFACTLFIQRRRLK